jgi:hypothetical protein
MSGTNETLVAADLVEVMERINDDLELVQNATGCLPRVQVISTGGYCMELGLSDTHLWDDQEDERKEVDGPVEEARVLVWECPGDPEPDDLAGVQVPGLRARRVEQPQGVAPQGPARGQGAGGVRRSRC